MSTSPSPTKIIESASSLVRREGGLVPFVRNVGFGGVSYAIILQLIEIITTGGAVMFGPVRALGRGVVLLVDGTFMNLLRTFDAGTAATVESFLTGTASLLGPFAQPVSIGVVMLTLFVFMWALNRMSISPIAFLVNKLPGR